MRKSLESSVTWLRAPSYEWASQHYTVQLSQLCWRKAMWGMQGQQEARDKCWVAQNGSAREWMGSGVYEYSQIIVNGVQKVQWNCASLMLLPLLCKELRAKADLGLLGVLTNEEIRILIFILQLGNPISTGRFNATWDHKYPVGTFQQPLLSRVSTVL